VALDEFVVEGIATTIPLHRRLIQEPRFLAGEVHTRFVEEWLDESIPTPTPA
jgi:acetyl-CoA carboxylase biotin carboxylase subunit